MNFANPQFFWAFLCLVPLIAIYFLKVRPVVKPVTAYFLWEQILQEKSSNSLFQRLRDLFSLLLMLIVFASIALAMTRPSFNQDQPKDLVLLIDNSASMSATNGLGSRLDSAKNAASRIVESLNGTQRCSVASISNQISYRSNLSDNPRELLQAIELIEPTVLPFDPEVLHALDKNTMNPIDVNTYQTVGDKELSNTNSLGLAVNDKAKRFDSYRVILLSDGLAGEKIPDQVELLKLGDHVTANLGFVSCDIQRHPGDSGASVFFQFASSFEKPQEIELTLSVGQQDNLVKLFPLTVMPGVNEPIVLEIDEAENGRWFFNFELDDALQEDNQAFAILPELKPVRVGVTARERFFFENSVLAFSNRGGLLQLAEKDCHLLIGQGKELTINTSNSDQSLRPNLMLFNPGGQSNWWFDLGEEIEVAIARVRDADHPVFRHFDPTTIPFVGARRLSAPPGAEIWIEAEDGTPLIYKATRSGVSAVIVNLDPLDSNFYFSAWFPIMVYSTAQHLSGRTHQIRSCYATTQKAPIAGGNELNPTQVISPSGMKSVVSTEYTFPLTQAGFYQL
ncbi:MAG: BatA and WFA domain-containing protein [Planctomycetota bacterium]